MGNTKKKAEDKLKARISSFDATGKGKQDGFTRPGSQNRHKQSGGSSGGKRRR